MSKNRGSIAKGVEMLNNGSEIKKLINFGSITKLSINNSFLSKEN